jgi:hypothetical protein
MVAFDYSPQLARAARLRLNRIAGRCPGLKSAFDRVDFAEAVLHKELRRTGA